MTYRVAEVFATLQGEGMYAGTPAVFVRFSGCNLWSGHDKDRARDAQRNKAACPLWCDTDFRKGEPCDAATLEEIIAGKMNGKVFPLIVFTGGEPLLQLDAGLLHRLEQRFPYTLLAIEANGTVECRQEISDLLGHICVSPKTAPETIKIRRGAELKIVFPAVDPLAFEELASGFTHRWVSPQANVGEAPGISYIDQQVTRAAVDFCLEHPTWKLSTQTHKILGLR